MSRLFLAAFGLLTLTASAFGAADFRAIRERYEKELLENVVAFWEKHSIDREYGGFITCLERDGRPYDTFKQMWMQWREVWMFAALYNSEYRQERWLKIAEDGFDFLYAHGRQKDGSYAYMLDRKGNVLSLAGDGGSEIFNESFAAVACAELYLATKNERYRAEALSAYASYRRRTSAAEKTYAQLAYPMIALNVVTVMNRAFGGFEDEIDRCIAAIRTFSDPQTGLIHERRFVNGAFDHDTQDGRFVNPGHTLEGLSFIFARLREKPDADLLKFALEKTVTMGEFGWDDEQGGVRYFRDEQDRPLMRNDAPLKAWWPQAEAMTAMLRAYEFSGERRYLDYFLKADAYVTANLRDAEHGEWFAYKAVDGRQCHSYKGSRYKGFFHIPRYLLDCIQVLKRLEARHAAPAAARPTWHVTGGTARFRAFLAALQQPGEALETYDAMERMPFDAAAKGDVFFILPDYEKGQLTRTEPDFDFLPKIKQAMDRGCRFYFENYVTPEYALDGRHSDLTGLQVLGRPRHVFQEYVVWDGKPLQARNGFYLPCTHRKGDLLAEVSDCFGTHKVSVPGKWHYPVLVARDNPCHVTAATDLSRFDPLYRRPCKRWRDLFAAAFPRVTGRTAAEVAAAFERTYPDPIRLAHGRDAAAAVKKAVDWHFKSGLMRAQDGSRGIFEMIRSDDLGVRRSLRTDAGLLSGALMVAAGRKYGNAEWEKVGRTLVDFLLDRGVQLDNGLFRWYDGCEEIWSSDSSRSGLALVNLWKATGDERYHERAKRLGDGFIEWLGDDYVCCGWYDIPEGMHTKPDFDNPTCYGEMVAFLLQLGEKKYTDTALGVVDRIMRKFPNVSPFGFSDNFTYARCLLMLACAQYGSDRDYSDKINYFLSFFDQLRHPCGGVGEKPIRLEEHTEAGVGMGDGSDNIADILYCNNFVLGATDVLSKLPPARRGTVDVAKAKTMADGLRKFFLDVQIASDDPRFDGGWMRAYDMDAGEYYGLNKDMDWGSYCIMGGWVMGFVPALLMNENDCESWYFNASQTLGRQKTE